MSEFRIGLLSYVTFTVGVCWLIIVSPANVKLAVLVFSSIFIAINGIFVDKSFHKTNYWQSLAASRYEKMRAFKIVISVRKVRRLAG